MILATIISLIAYVILMVLLIMANGELWSEEKKSIQGNVGSTAVSVIVPFRNEMENLENLFNALTHQNYPTNKYQIIFVDDHSEDEGVTLLQGLVEKSNIAALILQLDSCKGKKEAIRKGVSEAKGELIITTDADCTMNSEWLTTMVKSFETNGADLIVGPVLLKGKNQISLQRTEFAALIALTSGAIGIKRPILCNGANLGFRKEVFKNLDPYRNNIKIPSGDDVFFLHELKRKRGIKKINFVASESALVSTQGKTDGSAFIQQRVRWGKKSIHYTDRDTILIALLVCFANLSLVFLFITQNWQLFAGMAFVKMGFDLFLLISARRWLGLKYIFANTILLSIVYPFYFLLFALLSLLYQPTWKGRKA